MEFRPFFGYGSLENTDPKLPTRITAQPNERITSRGEIGSGMFVVLAPRTVGFLGFRDVQGLGFLHFRTIGLGV